MSRGKLIIISAPSGTGKSTIISWLMKEHKELNLAYSISCTSRPPRGAEQNGVDYFFLTPEEFRHRIENNEFLEYEEVYTDLRRRLEGRATDSPDVIDQRIARAEFELTFAKKFDKIVINDILEYAEADALAAIQEFLEMKSE